MTETPRTHRLRATKPRPRGILQEGQLLTEEGAWLAAKLGKHTLARARQSGVVTAIWIGNSVYYESSELMAWIRGHRGNLPANRGGKRQAN